MPSHYKSQLPFSSTPHWFQLSLLAVSSHYKCQLPLSAVSSQVSTHPVSSVITLQVSTPPVNSVITLQVSTHPVNSVITLQVSTHHVNSVITLQVSTPPVNSVIMLQVSTHHVNSVITLQVSTPPVSSVITLQLPFSSTPLKCQLSLSAVSSHYKCQLTLSAVLLHYKCQLPFSLTPHKCQPPPPPPPPPPPRQQCQHIISVNCPCCHHLTSVNTPSHQHLTSVIASWIPTPPVITSQIPTLPVITLQVWIPLSSPHKCQTSSQFSSPYQCEQPFSSTPHKRHHLTSVNPPVITSQVSPPLPHCHHLTSVNSPSHQHLTSVVTSQVWVLLSSPHKCQSSGTSRHEETWFWNRAISFVLNQVNMKFHNEHLKPSGNVLQAFSVTPSLCPNPASDADDCHHSSFFLLRHFLQGNKNTTQTFSCLPISVQSVFISHSAAKIHSEHQFLFPH